MIERKIREGGFHENVLFRGSAGLILKPLANDKIKMYKIAKKHEKLDLFKNEIVDSVKQSIHAPLTSMNITTQPL